MQLIVQNESFFLHILTEIKAGHQVIIPSKGNSMLPFIRPGTDEIELSPIDNNSIRKRNIVLAKTEEESGLVMKTLVAHNVCDIMIKNAIMFNAFIKFKCEKKVWKAIKKELNLEVDEVFVRFKKEES